MCKMHERPALMINTMHHSSFSITRLGVNVKLLGSLIMLKRCGVGLVITVRKSDIDPGLNCSLFNKTNKQTKKEISLGCEPSAGGSVCLFYLTQNCSQSTEAQKTWSLKNYHMLAFKIMHIATVESPQVTQHTSSQPTWLKIWGGKWHRRVFGFKKTALLIVTRSQGLPAEHCPKHHTSSVVLLRILW